MRLSERAKMMKKTHRSVTFFALRCDYRRTAVQIYFDCGAIFEVKMTEKMGKFTERNWDKLR